MIKAILINEIKDVIGHIPSQAELKSCIEYLADRINETKNPVMADVAVGIIDWRHDKLSKCRYCGDYFLSDSMTQIDDGDFCSDKCIINHQTYS